MEVYNAMEPASLRRSSDTMKELSMFPVGNTNLPSVWFANENYITKTNNNNNKIVTTTTTLLKNNFGLTNQTQRWKKDNYGFSIAPVDMYINTWEHNFMLTVMLIQDEWKFLSRFLGHKTSWIQRNFQDIRNKNQHGF